MLVVLYLDIMMINYAGKISSNFPKKNHVNP